MNWSFFCKWNLDDEVSNEKARKRASSPTYVEEQKALKNSFKKFLTDNNEYDSDADDTAGFLKIKVKNEEEKVIFCYNLLFYFETSSSHCVNYFYIKLFRLKKSRNTWNGWRDKNQN